MYNEETEAFPCVSTTETVKDTVSAADGHCGQLPRHNLSACSAGCRRQFILKVVRYDGHHVLKSVDRTRAILGNRGRWDEVLG